MLPVTDYYVCIPTRRVKMKKQLTKSELTAEILRLGKIRYGNSTKSQRYAASRKWRKLREEGTERYGYGWDF